MTDLSCGDHRILLTDRCGQRVVTDIPEVASLTWARTLDDTSLANLVIPIRGGALGEACCAALGDARAWVNEIAIERDPGGIVWSGPIKTPVFRRNEIAVEAADVTSWLDVRLHHSTRSFVQVDAAIVAEAIIRDALEPDDPCILDYLDIELTGNLVDYEMIAGAAYAGDALRDLSQSSLDFTALGRRIVIRGSMDFGPYGPLRDEHFLADIEVEERGAEAGTRWVVQGDGITGEAGGIDPFFGLIEQRVDLSGVTDQATVDRAAAGRLQNSNPTPIYVNVPADARLAPKSPIPIEYLVPGASIDVLLRDVCRPVASRQRLSAMSVQVTGEAGEAVGVTLVPPGIGFDEGVELEVTE